MPVRRRPGVRGSPRGTPGGVRRPGWERVLLAFRPRPIGFPRVALGVFLTTPLPPSVYTPEGLRTVFREPMFCV